jgi:sporadic carbohydrate cluster protein (TIGR04323 family)
VTTDEERKGLRGYVSSRPFGGFSIPVPLQSLALRDYCARRGSVYVLPLNENIFPNSYMVLEGMVEDLAGFEGVVMYSMHMLPERAERRAAIYSRIIQQGCRLHVVLEDITIGKAGDADRLEELLVLARMAAAAPRPAVVE